MAVAAILARSTIYAVIAVNIGQRSSLSLYPGGLGRRDLVGREDCKWDKASGWLARLLCYMAARYANGARRLRVASCRQMTYIMVATYSFIDNSELKLFKSYFICPYSEVIFGTPVITLNVSLAIQLSTV